MHYSAGFSFDPAILKALVDAGGNVELRSKSGHTPLHYAALYNVNPDILRTLIDLGASPNARNNKGKTPMNLTRKRADREILAAAGGADERNSRSGTGRGIAAAFAGAALGAAVGSGASVEDALAAGTVIAGQISTPNPAPERPTAGPPTTDSGLNGDKESANGTGDCLIPGFPSHDPAVPFTIPWCTSGGPQVETFAQYAVTLQCGMSYLDDPVQMAEMRRRIADICGRLDAMQQLGGNWNCKCPRGFGQ